MAQPGYADSIPQREVFDPVAQGADAADDFVTRNYRQFGFGQVAVDHVQIGATYPAGRDRDLHLPGAGNGIGHFHRFQRRAGAFENHCFHAFFTRGGAGCWVLPVMPAVSAKRIASSILILQGRTSALGTSSV